MKKSPIEILLLQDDTLQGAALVKLLETNRYKVERAIDQQAALDLAKMVDYDLILLDLQVPKRDGISLCRQLRSQNYTNPILLLTANNSDADVVAGFDAGADDYIIKPYAEEVLLAKIRTLLRRSQAVAPGSFAKESSAKLTWGNLCLDVDSGRVNFGDRIIALTVTEYNLLELLMRNPERIFSRSAILDRLWGFDDAPTDRAINTHIKDLRKKLKSGGLTEEIIETVYGMGYRLKAPHQAALPTNNDDTDRTSKNRSRAGSLPAVDKLLERFRGIFNQQVSVLLEAKAAVLAGNLAIELHHSAQHEAHKLAGSMASFGYPEASKLARSTEHLLISISGTEADRTLRQFTDEERDRFAQLVTAIQEELAKPPVTTTAVPVTSLPAILSHRVLVVDDDEALTERLQAASEAWGLRMKIAPNIAAARSRLAISMPDLILIDLSFPDTEEDGLTLLQEINERSPDLPVIVFTGRDNLADRLAVSRLGAKQFLHKPATLDRIFQAISRLLTKTKISSPGKVLIVDDDLAMLTYLSSVLVPWGLEVITLTEPQRFWDTIVATSPNLVILDLEMPQIGGLELCQVVRQDAQRADLPILVVTAHTDAESLSQAFAAGADDFITKPVLGPELVTRVLSRIERNRS
ncbi:MAG: response regulator [Microcoleus sp.]